MTKWHLLLILPLCAVVSIVYSATRSDDARFIMRESIRRFFTFVFWVIVLGAALLIFSKYALKYI